MLQDLMQIPFGIHERPTGRTDDHHMSLFAWTVWTSFTKGLQNHESLGTTTPTQIHIHPKGAPPMANSQDSRKETKKKPAKTTKEKRAEKKAKKMG